MKYLLCGINAKYIHSNLAVYCLRAYARRHGPSQAEYLIKEYTINHYVEDILTDLYEAGADVVVFSCYIWNITYVKELAAELKKVCPDISVWAGGPEVSYNAREFLEKNPAVDLVMQGEGEEQFTGLVGLWEKYKDSLSDPLPCPPAGPSAGRISKRIPPSAFPPGTVFQGRDTGPAPPVDMDEIPFVYNDFQLFDHKILYYETSRGCPFRCSYCLSSIDKSVRFRSLSLVLPELKRFLDAKVPQVKFVDRTFNCRRSHALAIWRYILENDNGITNFHFEISADLLGEEELALLEKMRPGLIQLEIGVQSTYGPAIKAIRRQMDLKALFANVDRIRAMGNIHQHLDLIAGLPYETYGQFKQSFNDLYVHLPDQLQLGFLKVLKGTYMEEKQEEYALSYRNKPPYEVLKTRWLGYDEIIRLKGVEDMVETYYNSMQFTWTLRYAVPFFPEPFDFYESLSAWYRKCNYHRTNHNRMEKYEILRDFLRDSITGEFITGESEAGENKAGEAIVKTSEAGKLTTKMSLLNELLILDMYFREKLKKRPSWAPDQSPYRTEIKQLYRERGKELFPGLWNAGKYDSKKAEHHSHIEKFSFDVMLFMDKGILEKRECYLLFDYHERNPLNYNACIRQV